MERIQNKYAMHLFLSDNAEYPFKFSNMQSELTANKLLDKFIEISLIDDFILEEERLYTRKPSTLPNHIHPKIRTAVITNTC